MPRLIDLAPAYSAQLGMVVEWITTLPDSAWTQPSRLVGWTVRDLAFHTTDMTGAVVRAREDHRPPDPPLTIARYTSAFPSSATEIELRDRAAAEGLDVATVLANAAEARADLLAALAGVESDPVIRGRRGPIRLSDLMAIRVNELVVHSLDLSASLPDVEPVALDRAALGVSCRMLTGILAERAPGRTVEVRVPPFAAVQCIEGPRHTRGTPPNVVEMAPATWVELATGRLSWVDALAAGQIRASGERADLTEHLPILA